MGRWSPTRRDRPRENRKARGARPESRYCWCGAQGSGGRGHPACPPLQGSTGGPETTRGRPAPRGMGALGRQPCVGSTGLPPPRPRCSALEGKKQSKSLFLGLFAGRAARGGRTAALAPLQLKNLAKKPGISCWAETRRFDSPSAGSAAALGRVGQGTQDTRTSKAVPPAHQRVPHRGPTALSIWRSPSRRALGKRPFPQEQRAAPHRPKNQRYFLLHTGPQRSPRPPQSPRPPGAGAVGVWGRGSPSPGHVTGSAPWRRSANPSCSHPACVGLRSPPAPGQLSPTGPGAAKPRCQAGLSSWHLPAGFGSPARGGCGSGQRAGGSAWGRGRGGCGELAGAEAEEGRAAAAAALQTCLGNILRCCTHRTRSAAAAALSPSGSSHLKVLFLLFSLC